MDYAETLDYLFSRLPMFTRDGEAAIKKDLYNTLLFCEHLNNPQNRFKSIHVAGTNGKGSTSHALASILKEAGYKTGLYTSPHLVDFRERIRINGDVIPENWVLDFVANYRDLIETIKPSFFEVTVAMAFQYFAEQDVDIAIIETGLGGRLDSTNVVRPVLSVITNISWDHASLLGGSLIKIAEEKAGIIKYQTPIVISEYQEEVAPVFIHKSDRENAALCFASAYLRAERIDVTPDRQRVRIEHLRKTNLDLILEGLNQTELALDLPGEYQLKNLPGILVACKVLHHSGNFVLSEDNVRDGLARVRISTGLRGRWETLSTKPLVICDTGHNEDGWKQVLYNIALTPHKKLHIVMGVMKDKDLQKMLPILPQGARYYFCQVDMPRALAAEELQATARVLGLQGKAFDTPMSALSAARNGAAPEDLIFVGGSTFVVGDILGKV